MFNRCGQWCFGLYRKYNEMSNDEEDEDIPVINLDVEISDLQN